MKSQSESNRSCHTIGASDQQLKVVSTSELSSTSELEDVIENDILQALQGLQFGEITITVHDGRVVQIERTSRSRQQLSKRIE